MCVCVCVYSMCGVGSVQCCVCRGQFLVYIMSLLHMMVGMCGDGYPCGSTSLPHCLGAGEVHHSSFPRWSNASQW